MHTAYRKYEAALPQLPLYYYRGAYRVPLFNQPVCLSVCVSVSVFVTFVFFNDCESCTRPISTNTGFMEARVYGLTRGTCFLTCGLELDAVAGLL